MTKDLWKQAQYKEIGAGGIKCQCCFDKLKRKAIFRRGRRRLKSKTQKDFRYYEEHEALS